jgi:hypothetical protein
MRAILATCAALLVAGSAIEAQDGPSFFYRKGTPTAQVEATVIDSAFKNIALGSDRRMKALDILKRADATASGFDRAAPDLQRQMCALRVKRNTELRGLLSTDSERAQFDENVRNPAPDTTSGQSTKRICGAG